MSTPLFLLIGLTLATCVIAYWSDNLGKKLGKKRVTLFGLRPRQTATLMTMTSSVVIMLFTFGVLLATNSGLRGALLRYDKERADNKRLRSNNQKLRSEQKALQADVQSAQQQASEAKKDTAIARKQADQAHDNYEEARGQLKQKQEQLKGAKSAERLARSNERQARSGERKARLRAEKAGRDLREKQEELGQVNQRLAFAQKDLNRLQRELRLAQGNVRQAQGRLTQVQGRLVEVQNRFLAAAKKSIEEEKRLIEQINQHTDEIEKLQTQKEALGSDIKQLKLLQIQLARPSRGENIDVPEGAVYADRLIPPRMGRTQIALLLLRMLAEGRDEVAKNNSRRTLQLLIRPSKEELPRELPQEEIIELLTQVLAEFTIPASVRLTSLRNHAKAETEIQCAFLVVPAQVAFRKNQIIVSKVIDGSQSDARIFNQLVYDLLNAGEMEANDRDVAPILRGGAKLYADGTNEQLFTALRRIQAIGKPVEVRLLADEDITTIDQLRVRFEIVTPAAEL